MVPWIAEADQKVLFKDNVHFKTPQEQVQQCFCWCMLPGSLLCTQTPKQGAARRQAPLSMAWMA